MRIEKLFLSILVCLCLFASAQAQTASKSTNASLKTKAACLSYEPEISDLSGQILRKTFVNASNKKETVWILKLAAPVCVNADSENEMNVKQNRVTEVQLVLMPEQYKKYRASLNQKVKASGKLFGGHTQHHFTDVLMIVEEINAR